MSAGSFARLAAGLLIASLAGCAARGPSLSEFVPHGFPPRIELEQTPFFPQDDYQCGPAALATVLAASGLGVAPSDLVPEVYLPKRRGSLQPELVASARRRGRLPYVLPPSVSAIVAQLASGLPVLVLQKLGAGPWPGWHYAVAVGYDVERGTMLLRSGDRPRLEIDFPAFLATWDRAGSWALVTLEPGTFPAEPDAGRYMEAAAGLESVGQLDPAEQSYRAAAARWPDEALTRLALANIAVARGDIVAAEREYRAAIRLDPRNVAAHNNLAEVLLIRGCPTAARSEVAIASQLGGTGPMAAAIADTRNKAALAVGPDARGCPSP